ncbi:MAG: Peptidoglycan-binding LysM, partial [Actinobacteria bacterium]|nr:Peptidoglycan-binding LysM [Actinomycetota bacterium]
MHIQRRNILRAAVLAAATAALFAAGVARAAEEERPRIFLEKRIFADSSGGKKSFYEVHTVAHGENLWKILNRRGVLPPAEYVRMLREFQRANPEVADVRKLKAGQKVLVPSAVPPDQDPRVLEGKVVPHLVAAGDTLTRLLAARGVSRRDLPRYLAAIKEINESVRDVNRIMAGSTILLPSVNYFAKEIPKETPPPVALAKEVPPAAMAKEAPSLPQVALGPSPPLALPKAVPLEPPTALAKEAPPAKDVTPAAVAKPVPPLALSKAVPPEPPTAPAKEAPPGTPLTKEAQPVPVMAVDAPGRPEAQIRPSPPAQAVAPVIE